MALYSIRSFISVIAVLNNCISIPLGSRSPFLTRLRKIFEIDLGYPFSDIRPSATFPRFSSDGFGNSRFLIKSSLTGGRDRWKEKCWHSCATRCQTGFYEIGYRPKLSANTRESTGVKKSFAGLKWKFDRVPVEIPFAREWDFEQAVLLISVNSMVNEYLFFFPLCSFRLFSFSFFLFFFLMQIIMAVRGVTLLDKDTATLKN